MSNYFFFSRLSDPRKSLAISRLVAAIIFFGLCGSFLSRHTGIDKLHYYIFLSCAFAVVVLSINKDNIYLYLSAGVLLIVGVFVSGTTYAFLSYFALVVAPLIWFSAGTQLNLQALAQGCLIICLILLFGLFLELSGLFESHFSFIGYYLGSDSLQRYGSFTENALALGYFACCSSAVALCSRKKAEAALVCCSSVVLLTLANSRGAFVTFVVFIVIFVVLSIMSKRHGSGRLMIVSIVAMLVAFISVFSLSERLQSIFDFTFDKGNVSRAVQWRYCIDGVADNLAGHGAGAMSPVGFGGEAIYIYGNVVRSCESLWLKLAYEYGIIVAAAYFVTTVSLVAVVLIRALRTRTHGRPKEIATYHVSAVVALVAAIFLQQVFNQTLESVWLGAVFYSLLGWCFAHLTPSRHVSLKRSDESLAYS